MSKLAEKTRLGVHFLVLLMSLAATNAWAQSSEDYHPFLTDKYQLQVGLFAPSMNFDIQASGRVPGDDIDFDKVLGIDDSERTPEIAFRWNFGEKWMVSGQAWTTDSSGGAILTKDVEWEDLVFQAGSNVRAGVENSVIRVFFGRRFSTGPQHEFGVGAGLHWMKVNAFIEGEAFINGEASGFQRGSVSSGVPLPNIGAWYYYSPAPHWLLSARLDWLSANIGNYKGGLWNSAVGANFQISRHFGIGLQYQFFQLDVDVDKSDWKGKAKISQKGPFLALTATW